MVAFSLSALEHDELLYFILGLPLTPSEEQPAANNQFSALYSDYFGVRNIANKNTESGSDQQIILLVQEMESKFNYSVSSTDCAIHKQSV